MSYKCMSRDWCSVLWTRHLPSFYRLGDSEDLLLVGPAASVWTVFLAWGREQILSPKRNVLFIVILPRADGQFSIQQVIEEGLIWLMMWFEERNFWRSELSYGCNSSREFYQLKTYQNYAGKLQIFLHQSLHSKWCYCYWNVIKYFKATTN